MTLAATSSSPRTEAIVHWMGLALPRLGYAVRIARTAKEALETFETEPGWPSALLLDLTFPDGSGFDVFRRVRAVRPDLPVLVMSGTADVDSLAPLESAGARFVWKPFGLPDLRAALGTLPFAS
jgi:DNA-binding response OmpR family regulator